MNEKQELKKPVTVRLPEKLIENIKAEANKNDRSFNGQVVFSLKNVFQHRISKHE